MENKIAFMQVSQKAALFRKGKLLIVETSYFPGRWDLPGGRLDEGEDTKSAFDRELKEELGLEKYQFLRVADYDIWRSKKGLNICMIVNLISSNQEELILSEEHRQLRWIDEFEIEDFDFVWNSSKNHQLIHNCFDLKKRLDLEIS